MIRATKNISRQQFRMINFCPSLDQPKNNTHAYISIHSLSDDFGHSSPPKINHSLWLDGIQIAFDDIEFPYKDYKLFDTSQAETILAFVKKMHTRPEDIELVVHCYAGVSRSAAVSKFVNDYLGLRIPKYEYLDVYNSLVYRKLVEASLKIG